MDVEETDTATEPGSPTNLIEFLQEANRQVDEQQPPQEQERQPDIMLDPSVALSRRDTDDNVDGEGGGAASSTGEGGGATSSTDLRPLSKARPAKPPSCQPPAKTPKPPSCPPPAKTPKPPACKPPKWMIFEGGKASSLPAAEAPVQKGGGPPPSRSSGSETSDNDAIGQSRGGKKGDDYQGRGRVTEKWRPRPDKECGRFGNRGGKLKEWWAAFHHARKFGKESLDAFLMAHPKPTS